MAILSLDTYALMEIANDSLAYRGIEREEFIVTSAAWAEFHLILTRRKGEAMAWQWTKKLLPYVEDIDKEIWLEGVLLRMKNPKENLSLIDALGYAHAQRKGYLFVTGDQAFKGKKGVRFIA